MNSVKWLLLAAAVATIMALIASHQAVKELQETTFKSQPKWFKEYLNRRKDMEFDEWQSHFAKNYQTQEERVYRSLVYSNNLLKVRQHNLRYEMGLTSFFKAVNHMSDLTDSQFTSTYSTPFQTESQPLQITQVCNGSIMDAPNPPVELDWGNKVSSVLNQGECGKDWAMVAASAIQSLYALKIGSLPTLSVQQLVECSVYYGNEGCYGGFMDQAFWYVIDKGIAADKTYQQREVAACKYVPNMKFTGIGACARVPEGSYSKLLSAVVQQPTSVALDYSPDMREYAGGVFTGQCSTKLTHAMLLTGYGGDIEDDYYWKLKNTVGAEWGNKGYIMIKRYAKEGEGKCGIQRMASIPQKIA